jgi:hypothetical protein
VRGVRLAVWPAKSVVEWKLIVWKVVGTKRENLMCEAGVRRSKIVV